MQHGLSPLQGLGSLMIDEPRGLGGWLLLFTLSLGLRSLLALVSVLTPLSLLPTHPGSRGVLASLAAASLGAAMYSGWMATVFWRLKPDAVRRLTPYFAFMLAYGIFGIAVPYFPHEPALTEYLATFVRMGISMLVYVGIWTAYFKNSRRVAHTFGH